MRHTALSWLIEAGVDYAVVQRLVGHRIPGMTESYLHLWESRLREAVTVLERVTIEKLQAAMNDERGVVQLPKDGAQDASTWSSYFHYREKTTAEIYYIAPTIRIPLRAGPGLVHMSQSA